MMVHRFRRQVFDIAPQAPRFTPAAWAVLASALVFLLGSAWALLHTMQQLDEVQVQSRQSRGTSQREFDRQRQDAASRSDPVLLAQNKAAQQLQAFVRTSWFGLFDALEAASQAVHGGVSLLSLTPAQTQEEPMQVRLTAAAASPALLLSYLEALRKEAHIASADLLSHTADRNIGPHAVRAQLVVSWNARFSPPAASANPALGQRSSPATTQDAELADLSPTPVVSHPVTRVRAGATTP